MIPSLELANALDKAADLIEEKKEDFYWYNPNSCTMGFLARAITGKNAEQLTLLTERLGSYSWGIDLNTWRNKQNELCWVSGYEIPELYQILEEAGVEKQDFSYIEYLGQDFLNTMDESYKNPDNAILFFRQEARKMRKLLQPVPQVSKAVVKQVPVSVITSR